MFLIKNFIPKKFPKISLNFTNIKSNSYTSFKYNFNSFNFNNKMNQNRNNFENRPDFPEEMQNMPPKTDNIQKEEVYDSDSEDPSSFYNKRKKLKVKSLLQSISHPSLEKTQKILKALSLNHRPLDFPERV